MNKKLKTTLFLILKLAVTISLLYFIFQKYIQVNLLMTAAKNIIPTFLLPLLLIGVLNRWIMAYPVKVCLQVYQIYFTTFFVFNVQLISVFYSMFLPGDIAAGSVSWHLLSRDTGQRAQVASTLIYTRLLNLAILVLFALAGLFLEPRLIDLNLHIPMICISVLLVLCMLPFIWHPATSVGERISIWFIQKLPWQRVKLAVNNIWQSIHICVRMRPKHLLIIISFTLVSQIISIIVFWLMFQTVDIQVPVTLIFWLRAFLIIISLLPITFAGIGVRELTLIHILQKFYSVAPEKALILSVIMFIFNLITGVLLGAFFNITLRKTSK